MRTLCRSRRNAAWNSRPTSPQLWRHCRSGRYRRRQNRSGSRPGPSVTSSAGGRMLCMKLANHSRALMRYAPAIDPLQFASLSKAAVLVRTQQPIGLGQRVMSVACGIGRAAAATGAIRALKAPSRFLYDLNFDRSATGGTGDPQCSQWSGSGNAEGPDCLYPSGRGPVRCGTCSHG